MALKHVIGFIGESPILQTYEVNLSSCFQASYLTGFNADGKFEKGESPSSKYQIYVLSSGYTFSCGNIFAYYAKENGPR